jgi:hypothetical protein
MKNDIYLLILNAAIAFAILLISLYLLHSWNSFLINIKNNKPTKKKKLKNPIASNQIRSSVEHTYHRVNKEGGLKYEEPSYLQYTNHYFPMAKDMRSYSLEVGGYSCPN